MLGIIAAPGHPKDRPELAPRTKAIALAQIAEGARRLRLPQNCTFAIIKAEAFDCDDATTHYRIEVTADPKGPYRIKDLLTVLRSRLDALPT